MKTLRLLKFNIFSLFFLILCEMVVSCTPPPQQKNFPDSAGNASSGFPPKFHISNQKENSVNQDVFGFNTANFFHHYKNKKEIDGYLKELNPSVLRFPGGTTANFYHFNEKGYGYSPQDAAIIEGSKAHRNIIKSLETDQKIIRNRKVGNNFAAEFSEIAKETGSKVLLVANLFTGKDEEILEMVDFFLREKVEIIGIELGNEYYFKAYESVFPDVESYIFKARETAQRIKERFPEIPLAVVAASSTELKETSMKRAEELDHWNQQLGKETFYDAYVTHLYSKSDDCNTESRKEEFECAMKNNADYSFNKLPKALAFFEKFYGNKPAWVTEWNIHGVFDGYGNTFLQAAYIADFLLEMTAHKNIQVAAYHNLLAAGKGYNIIGSRNNEEKNENEKHLKLSGFYAHALLSPVFRSDVVRLKNPITKEEEIENLITVRAFQTGEQETIIFIINKSEKPFDLSKVTIDENIKFSEIQLASFVQDSLQKEILPQKQITENPIRESAPKILGEILIEKYSINRITLIHKK